MSENKITVTISGASLDEVKASMSSFLGAGVVTTIATKAQPKAAPKKTAPQPEPEEIEDTFEVGEVAQEDDDLMSFEADEEPAPKVESKKAVKKETTKLTDKDVHNACVAHAKANGKQKTMAVLNKKFGVKSVLELKAAQYAEAIKALAV